MIIQILQKAPFYAWPLLAYILYVGVKARKKNTVPLVGALLIPFFFFCWASYGIFKHTTLQEILLLGGALTLGCSIGFAMVRSMNISVDKSNQLLEIPGSSTTLFLALSIFTLKFSSGVLVSLHPELKGTWFLLAIELVATLISGLFAGMGIGYLYIYKKAP